MKTRKKTTMIMALMACFSLVLLAMLLTAGCAGSGFFRGKTELKTYDFRKGTEGVDIEFLEGMPPRNVYIGTEFTTALRLKNMGAYDITDRAELKISVPDTSAFDFKEGDTDVFTLRGKSLYIKEGEEDIITFPMKALCFKGYATQAVTNYTKNMRAKVCYYYETTANADLCIDTRKFQRQEHERPECEMKDLRLSGGQGGPVGVVSISPTIIPQSEKDILVQLGVSIKELRGTDYSIYHPDSGCDVYGKNSVVIDVEMGGQPLVCKPSEIKLKAREAVGTICNVKVDSSLGAYLTPVTVSMKYYVQQSLAKEITVNPPPGIKPGKEGEFCASVKGK